MKSRYVKILIVVVLFVAALLSRVVYMTPSYQQGEAAPVFEGTLITGEPFSLDELRGEYTLIHFWGSWCGPCRIENPKLSHLWFEFKDKTFKNETHFNIVSIAVETEIQSPTRAIQKDGLMWKYHLIDIGESLVFFDSPISDMWGVNQVPTNFLLNPELEIIGYNLSHNALEAFLRTNTK